MSDAALDRKAMTTTLVTLFDEAHLGPAGKGTWFIDNDPGSGLFGTLEALDAAAASRPLTPGDPLSAASHADHLRFALNLANRATRGENPYPTADWSTSWQVRTVDGPAWKALVGALRKEYEDLKATLQTGAAFNDPDFATGTFGLVAHAAWHLGALRQGLGLIRAPAKG